MKTLNELNGLVLSDNTIEAYYKQQALAKTKPIKQARQARPYKHKKPIGPTMPKARDYLLVDLMRGTECTYKRNVNQLDAKHKSSTMPDPVTMSELNRKIALERPNDNAITMGLVCLWFKLYEGILFARERRALRRFIDASNYDAAEALIIRLKKGKSLAELA